jgi:predicted alpha/beta superfamily hydrolase
MIIQSGFNHKNYQLNVSLPKNYSTKDSLRYPVLYVLDGKYSYKSFSSIREMLDLANEIENVIIVTIEGNASSESDWLINRHTDYTPTPVPKADTLWEKILKLKPGVLKSGGADAFLNTLKKDIIPLVDRQYKTTNNRGLFGHSLGGLFAAYCLLTSPELFNRYSINSPSFWWNDQELLALERSFTMSHESLSAKIFMSVGSLEGPMMVTPMTNFANALKARNYNGVTLTTQIFDSETHVSVVPAASSRTLKVLYRFR